MKDVVATNFLVIDDDPINNNLCRMCIRIVYPGAEIMTFTDSAAGLAHIRGLCTQKSDKHVILFLDINMPGVNGWETLEELTDCYDMLKDNFRVFIFSSSVALEDKQRAGNHPLITAYLEKPLTMAMLKKITQAPGLQ